MQDIREAFGRGEIHTIEATFGDQRVVGNVLHVKDVYKRHDEMYDELREIPERYVDKTTNGWGKSGMEKSRWNTNVTDRKVKGNVGDPDPSKRRNSEYPYSKLARTRSLRKKLTKLGRTLNIPALMNLNAEVNYYGIKKPSDKKPPAVAPGIGFHIDFERNIVIAFNLGTHRILCLTPFCGSQPIGAQLQIQLAPGDMYIFDSIASGVSYRGAHIRHAASGGRGDLKYIERLNNALKAKLKKKAENPAWVQSEETKAILAGNGPTIRI